MSVAPLPQSLVGALGAAASGSASAKSADDAAFSGVLDRIATGTKTGDLGDPKRPAAKGLDGERGRPASIDARPTDTQRDEETSAETTESAGRPATDLSALAQAAAGAVNLPTPSPIPLAPQVIQLADAAGVPAEAAVQQSRPASSAAVVSSGPGDRSASLGSAVSSQGQSTSASADRASALPAAKLPGAPDDRTSQAQGESASTLATARPAEVPPSPQALATNPAGSDPRRPGASLTDATGGSAAADRSVDSAVAASAGPDLPQPLPAAVLDTQPKKSSDHAPAPAPSNPRAAGPSKPGGASAASGRVASGKTRSAAQAAGADVSAANLPSVPAAGTTGPAAAGPGAPSAATQQVLAGLQSIGLTSVSSRSQITASRTAAALEGLSGADAQKATPSLKTLTIQLSPEHLGPVSITMRLNAEGIDVQIAVANPHTLRLLDKDRHLLSAAIEAAGGSKEALGLVGATSDSGSATRESFAGSPQNGGNGQTAFSSNTSSDGRAASRGTQTDVPIRSQSDADDAPDPVQRPQPRRSDSLYV